MLHIENSLKDTLKQTTPYFEENIKANFLDEIERRFENDRIFEANLKPAFVIDGNTTTELSKLKIMKSPNFVVKDFKLSLENLYIWLVLEIPELMVEGVYKNYGNDVQSQNVTEEKGNIMFVFENIVCQGAVPIQISEDSYIVKHYYLTFNPSEVKTKKSTTKDGKVDSSETTANNIDSTYARAFLPSLRDSIFYMLFRDLAAPIVEFSVSELYADEPEEAIELSESRCRLADNMIQAVLRKVAESNKSQMAIPDFNLVFSKDGLPCSLQCTDGVVGKLSLWFPEGDNFAVYEHDKVLYLEGELRMGEFKYEYKKCCAKIGNEETNGSISAEAVRPKFSFKASLRPVGDGYATQLEHIKYYRLLDVDFNKIGLENLDGFDDQVEDWMTGFFESVISEKICSTVEELFKKAVENAELPSLTF